MPEMLPLRCEDGVACASVGHEEKKGSGIAARRFRKSAKVIGIVEGRTDGTDSNAREG